VQQFLTKQNNTNYLLVRTAILSMVVGALAVRIWGCVNIMLIMARIWIFMIIRVNKILW